MLLPYSWLKDYLNETDLKKGKWTADKIGQRLSTTFNEYEGTQKITYKFPKVVVGQVKKIEKHSFADRLNVATVDIGKKTSTIVCGADNLYVGMFVPVALPGAKLGPEGEFVIRVSEIRGIESHGMICSAEELGLEEKSIGILDLGKGLKSGVKLDDAISFDDELLELTVTSNRADATNVIGVAKEVSVSCNIRFNLAKFNLKENSPNKIDDLISVQIKDPDACRRYSSRVIENISVVESPLWLKRRLVLSGMRPINAIVDITNYVLLEYGQPMHAFDRDLVIGHKIVVRRAKKGERIITLDDQKKVLNENDLIIADEKRPLAIAGIIGGQESGVIASTKTVVLESANFARDNINRSSKNHGITTDSSIMFGKGIPMSKTGEALDRAAYLIQQICGGQIARGVLDVRAQRILKRDITIEYQDIFDLLGTKIGKNEIKKILKDLEFEITDYNDERLTVVVPDYRDDIEYREDLIEEVGRIYGYDNIPDQVFTMPVNPPHPEIGRRYKNKIIRYFYHNGCSEVYSYNFVSDEDLGMFGFDIDKAYEVENPVDKNVKYLRASLLPGLLHKAKSWIASGENTSIFEWGRVNNKATKPTEQDHFAFLYHHKKSNQKGSFLHAKGLLMGMLAIGGRKLDNYQLVRAVDAEGDFDYLHPYNSLIISFKNKKIGSLGVIHPRLAQHFKLPVDTIVCEMNLKSLISTFDEMFVFESPSKFPSSLFDASFIVTNKTMAQSLIDTARKAGGQNLKDIVVFDEYIGDSLGEDQKSISLRFTFQSPIRTLADNEVEEKMDKIFKVLVKEHSAVLRNN